MKPDASVSPQVHVLPAELWARNGMGARSRELTPRYVHRYCGPHQAPGPSAHPFWEFLYIFHGQGRLHAAGVTPLAADTACLIPAGLPHREEAAERVDTLWVALEGTRLRHLDATRVLAVAAAELTPAVEALWQQTQRPYGLIGAELDGLTRTILGRFLRRVAEERTRGADTIDEAADHLSQHFDAAINITRLAARYGYSPGHFHRSFKRRTGQTPNQFLTAVRIRHAWRWLKQSALPVERIAELVGYSDPLYFSRVFRKTTGRSPTAVRFDNRPPQEDPHVQAD